MKLTVIAPALASAALFAAAASAGQYEAGLLGHYTWEDNDREYFDNSAGISIDGIYIFDKDKENESDADELSQNGISLRYTQTLFDADETLPNPRDAIRSALHIGWWHYLDEAVAEDEDDNFRGYINLGLGIANLDGRNDPLDETGASAMFAIGAVTRNGLFSDRLKLRAEARADYDDVQGGVLDLSVGIGIHWPFAAAPVPVVATACPDVEATSCRAVDVIDFNPVYFDVDKSTILEDDAARMDKLAETLNKQGDLIVDLLGHADSTYETEYNLELSRTRANDVRDYLISKGVAASRIRTYGVGEYVPYTGNDTVEGRAANRRVEFYLRKRD